MPSIKEEIAKNLLFFRKQRKMTQKELAEVLGVKSNTISSWENGTNSIDTEVLFKVCQTLDVSIVDMYGNYWDKEEFNNFERAIIKKYRALDEHGKKMVDLVLNEESARLTSTAAPSETGKVIYFGIRRQDMSMSAGYGDPETDDSWSELLLTKRPPRGTSYVAQVNGVSMEPTYHTGDLLFVRAQEEIRPGEIGVFWMDGKQWVKELGDGVLISHNPEYAPIPITEDIRCQGKVLGICNDEYFNTSENEVS